jgi:isopenicillin-N epimerase
MTTVGGVFVDWALRRDLFTLDRRTAHLNHGSYGAVPLPVQRAQQRLRDEMEANPIAFFTRGLLERIQHARAHLAAFVGADSEGVALVSNATAAATAVLRSVPLRAGGQILLTDHVYGAVRFAAEEVAGRVGAHVRVVAVPLTAGDDEVVDRVTAAVTPGRTRLAIVDHVASATAKLFPVDDLVAALHERNVAVLVDAAHAPGMLPVDVRATGADFWLGNLHKWAFTPRPTALLAVAPEHRAAMRPLVVSWEQAAGFPSAQEFAGTLDYTAWLAAPAGVHFLRTLGPDRVRSHNGELAQAGQQLVARAMANRATADPLLELALDGRLGSAAVSMRLVPPPPTVTDRDSMLELRRRLAVEHRVEIAVAEFGNRPLLRISGQVYNELEDYQRLADALRVLA